MITGLFYKGTSFFIGNLVKRKDSKTEAQLEKIFYDDRLGEYRFVTNKGETGPEYVDKITEESREIGAVI